jgi:dTDP-4-dehydrorhamnose reductase
VKTAVFVPRGVGNAFQTLEDETVYSYLVTEHWSPAAKDSYTFLNLADETVAIDWPIPLADAELSAADRAHPRLAEVRPMPPKPTLVLGANGQVGQALTAVLPDAIAVRRDTVDLADPASVAAFDFVPYGVVVNAAAYTKVDAAETDEGRREAWATNVSGTAALVAAAREHHHTLVHISSDYVFDGTVPEHTEDEPFSPLGVYAQTKAAGDALVATCPAHYIVRSSWVIGEGSNFVKTMASLADRGIEPSVVDDQYGRLTFASEIARAIRHLLETQAPYGTYHLSNEGEPMSWADIAEIVFVARGREATAIRRVSTADYGAGKALAPRPQHSTFALDKIRAAGFEPRAATDQLRDYLAALG